MMHMIVSMLERVRYWSVLVVAYETIRTRHKRIVSRVHEQYESE